ncbi:hypothetical protein [Pseudomonas sp. BRM28]|uniref:hypothetical protein n=1 Tax=Pseudomonas sp. BRM28 TaxID=2045201 RepID=UPI000CEF1B81|nr:hypothetical protein CR917_12930 [Pseudomonas sp. BRM28]
MPYPLLNSIGDQPLERYNVAPTTRVAVLRLEEEKLRADLVRWGGGSTGPRIDNWLELLDESGSKIQA